MFRRSTRSLLADLARWHGRTAGRRVGVDLSTLGLLLLVLGLLVNRVTLPSLGVETGRVDPILVGGVLLLVFLVAGLVGLLTAWVVGGRRRAVAARVDRNLGFEDRVRTVLDLGDRARGAFAQALEAEVAERLRQVRGPDVWPMRRRRLPVIRFLVALVLLIVLSQYLQLSIPGVLPEGGSRPQPEIQPTPRCSYSLAEESGTPGVWLLRYVLYHDAPVVTDVVLEFAVEGTPFQPMTAGPAHLSDGLVGLEASPEGVPHVFAWDVAVDLPGSGGDPCDALVRVLPGGSMAAGCGGVVLCGEQPPELACTLDALRPVGDGQVWEVHATLYAPAGEAEVTPRFEFARPGQSLVPATPASTSAIEPVLATAAGTRTTFLWDAGGDTGSAGPCDATVRMTLPETGVYCEARITCEGTPISCRIDALAPLEGGAPAAQLVHFTLFGPPGATVGVDLELGEGEGAWAPVTLLAGDPASATTFLTSPEGEAHTLAWDAAVDVPGHPCEVRLALDVRGQGDSDPVRCTAELAFGGGARVADVSVRAQPDDPCVWPIDFRLVDPLECPTDLAVEYSLGSGGSDAWFAATEAEPPAQSEEQALLDRPPTSGRDDLLTSVEGARHTFLWDAGADLGDDASLLVGQGVKLRLRPLGGGATGVIVDDAVPAPSCEITGAAAGPVDDTWLVRYRLLACAAPGQVTTDVRVTFTTEGTRFDPATPGAGGQPTEDREASREGTEHSFAWSYRQDLPELESGAEPCGTTLRVEVLDRQGAFCESPACPEGGGGGGASGGGGGGGGDGGGGGETPEAPEQGEAPEEGAEAPTAPPPTAQEPAPEKPPGGEEGEGEAGNPMEETAGGGMEEEAGPLFGEETEAPEDARFEEIEIEPLFAEDGGYRDAEVLVPPMRGKGEESEGTPTPEPEARRALFDAAMERVLYRHVVSPRDESLVRRYFEFLRRVPGATQDDGE